MSFTFYFGAASGSARKALQMMKEPNVMISFATQNNRPWYGIDSLFVDSGGYSMMKTHEGEYGPLEEYVEYIRRWEPEMYALRDYPCEPDLLEDLGRTVEEHQRRTIEDSVETLHAVGEVRSTPVTVLQGWTASDYVRCIEMAREAGLPLEYVGIGSVCRRNAEGDIRRIVLRIREELPQAKLHAFGVKTSSLTMYPEIVDALDSADSLAYDYRAKQMRESKTWRDSAVSYWKMARKINESVERPIDNGQQRLHELA